MKTTQPTLYRNLLQQLNRNQDALAELRVRAASGKRLSQASDDPGAVRSLLNYRSQIQGSERYSRTMAQTAGQLEALDSHLGYASNLLVRARELAVAGGNGALNDGDRQSLADEVAQLQADLLATANAQVNGKYLFSGFEESTRPLTGNPGYDPVADPRPVLYNGDSGQIRREISPGEQVVVNLNARELFLGDSDGDGSVDAGKADLFAVLTDLEAALRANDQTAVRAQLDGLDNGMEQVRLLRGKMGNLTSRLEESQVHMDEARVDLEELLAQLEEADVLEAISQMTQQETALEAALNVTARISKISILNYF